MAMLKDKLGDLAQHQHPYDVWLKKERQARIAVPNRAKKKSK
jgi:hypothetical protein